ncbi:caspase family protein [Microcoleus sp. herbarium2]|uniref:caspase family protein n=1 Tax=Microcoleus sp. herbarium2 TaxID=3055433 RepID=UPI002FD27320
MKMPSERNVDSSEDVENQVLGVAIPTSYPTYVDHWAIVVGISKYKYESLNLKYADRDAEELVKLLQAPSGGDFEDDRIVTLINEDATTANITRALRSFLKKPARKDIILIYFASYGAPDIDRPHIVYLLTHETDPRDISGTALLMREVDLSLTGLKQI